MHCFTVLCPAETLLSLLVSVVPHLPPRFCPLGESCCLDGQGLHLLSSYFCGKLLGWGDSESRVWEDCEAGGLTETLSVTPWVLRGPSVFDRLSSAPCVA